MEIHTVDNLLPPMGYRQNLQARKLKRFLFSFLIDCTQALSVGKQDV